MKLGINLIVLDDGWFCKRNDITTSLGDWVIDTEKFPDGLKALVDDINRIGCKFGLWIEPEMVSEQSVCILLLIERMTAKIGSSVHV